MPNSGFIYIWTNKINGMQYIGKRWGEPTSSYIGSGKYFKSAIKKYGLENFERKILDICETRSLLKEREKYWLDFYQAATNNNFYNISPNSDGGHHGANYVGEKNPMYGKKHPNHKPHYGEENGMYGVHRNYSDNPNSKSYLIIDNEGREWHSKCLKEFVDNHFSENKNKVYQSLKEQAIRGTFKSANKGHCKGWRIKYDDSI